MNRKVLIVASILIAGSFLCYFILRDKPLGEKAGQGLETENPAAIANPAAVYCEDQGGVLRNVTFEKGQKGFCLFEDGSECGQWDFFNRKCGKGDLKIKVLAEGEGKRIDNGDTAVVHYVGTFEDGTKFDSSLDSGRTFSFTLGAGQVIDGWDQGVLGMRAGERRTLTIAPALGYGETGAGEVIPPNTTLIFIVELMRIE